MMTSLKSYLLYFCLCMTVFTTAGIAAPINPWESTQNLPVAYQGRFRALDSAAKLWLYDYYHKDRLKQADLTAFHSSDGSPVELLWRFHFLGHRQFDDTPLFWLHYAAVKSLLKLDSHTDRFSYHELSQAINNDQVSNLQLMDYLLSYEFARNYLSAANRSRSEKSEITSLASGLWLSLRGDALIVAAAPPTIPWQFLKPGHIVAADARARLSTIEKQHKPAADEIMQLMQAMHGYAESLGAVQSNETISQALMTLEKQHTAPQEIFQILENRSPLLSRLQKAGSTLKMLPSRQLAGEWLSLHALTVVVYHPQQRKPVLAENFTTFADDDFHRLRTAYMQLEAAARAFYGAAAVADSTMLEQAIAHFVEIYSAAYIALANTPFKQASGKELLYPSLKQLQAESWYYRLPLIEISIVAYFCALLLFLAAYRLKKHAIERLGFAILLIGFLLHTAVLALRCYVLQRPPVSNMFETLIYVPWIALVVGLIFYVAARQRLVLCAACLTSLALLVLLKLTHIDARLENVQAVLDSQYWLIVHVLMVVGSYGAFAVCGILGHAFVLALWQAKQENAVTQLIARGILHTMYVGVALLIPGTILGGIWAAESWGRFWDWDPKESWAFISACVYVLVIHAYTFQRIRDFGLAVGAIGGLMAISFTWYGVNYILGTGLHSYGFGKGGESSYFIYLAVECLFIMTAFLLVKNKKLLERK